MQVVIVGAGFGGIAAARDLAASKIPDLSITLIDQSPHFYVGLTKLWVATGARKPEECQHSRDLLNGNGIRFLNAVVSEIDLDERTVMAGSERLEFDQLLLACGLDIRPDLIDGLENHGHNLYSMLGAVGIYRALENLNGGVIQIVIGPPPFKCPPAPYEAALMIDEFLRKRGVRDQSRIIVSSPEPRPLPVLPTPVGEKVREMVEERKIEYHPERKVVSVQDGKVSFENEEDDFDLLIAVPPHRSPEIAAVFGPLVTPAGMVPVDRYTLRTKHDGVYAIGDIAGVMTFKDTPIPRAGVFAESQGKVAASQIISEALGTEPATLDGIGYCFLEVGGEKALKVEARFLDPEGPSSELKGSPSAEMFEEKKRFESDRVASWFGKTS